MVLCRFHHQTPGHDQGFLVGQSDVLSGPDRLHGRHQANSADNGGHHHIGISKRCHPAVPGITPKNLSLKITGQHVSKGTCKLLVSNGNAGRRKFPHLLGQQGDIFPCGQADNSEPIRIGPDNGQDISANGTGGSQ